MPIVTGNKYTLKSNVAVGRSQSIANALFGGAALASNKRYKDAEEMQEAQAAGKLKVNNLTNNGMEATTGIADSRGDLDFDSLTKLPEVSKVLETFNSLEGPLQTEAKEAYLAKLRSVHAPRKHEYDKNKAITEYGNGYKFATPEEALDQFETGLDTAAIADEDVFFAALGTLANHGDYKALRHVATSKRLTPKQRGALLQAADVAENKKTKERTEAFHDILKQLEKNPKGRELLDTTPSPMDPKKAMSAYMSGAELSNFKAKTQKVALFQQGEGLAFSSLGTGQSFANIVEGVSQYGLDKQDVERLQNKKFTKLYEGYLSNDKQKKHEFLKFMKNSADNMPTHAVRQATKFLSMVQAPRSGNVSKEYVASYDFAKELERMVGPAHMKTLMKENFTEYKLARIYENQRGNMTAGYDALYEKRQRDMSGNERFYTPDFHQKKNDYVHSALNGGLFDPKTSGVQRALIGTQAMTLADDLAQQGMPLGDIEEAIEDYVLSSSVKLGGSRIFNGRGLVMLYDNLAQVRDVSGIDEVVESMNALVLETLHSDGRNLDVDKIVLRPDPSNMNIIFVDAADGYTTISQRYTTSQLQDMYNKKYPDTKKAIAERNREQQ